MVSEKSHRTGYSVRSKPNAGEQTVAGQARNSAHFISKIEPDKLLQTACLRIGRFVEKAPEQHISIMKEEGSNGKLMRITEYRTLTTCTFCNKGYR